MAKHCGNCAVYDRQNMKHSELCGKCITEHFPNGKESDPSMWKPLPQTNADRIRAMSDEELADWLARTQIANVAEALAEASIPFEQSDGLKDGVVKGCLEWLRQPTK